MDIVGFVFLALLALMVLVGLILVATALPDITRYRRIRRM
jgi:hypothetical protein